MRSFGLKVQRAGCGSEESAEALNADPAAADGEQAENDERDEHGPGALVGVGVFGARLAEEGQYQRRNM